MLAQVVTGHLSMIKKVNNNNGETTQNFHKLSIQVSLNGLSFCVLDTISNTILASESIFFKKQCTPYEVQKELQGVFKKNDVSKDRFSEIIVIHRNTLFSLVPKSLFDANELPNYLKFNAKILANDHLAYDEIDSYDMVNVYVPFVNINNYIYDLFGEFEFKHSGTVMVESLLNGHTHAKEPVCYVHVAEHQMDITVISEKKLLLYNSFEFVTKEDFIYYLLFTMEQLKLDTEQVQLKLFGAIDDDDDIYRLCYEYVKLISIFIPSSSSQYPVTDLGSASIDFTVLNAL